MENTPEKKRDGDEGGGGGRRGNNAVLLLIVFASVLAIMYFNRGTERSQISYSFFESELARGNIESVRIGTTYVTGRFKTPPPPEPLPGQAEDEPSSDDDKPEPLLKDFRYERLPDDGSIKELKDELLRRGVHVEGIPKDNTYDILSFLMILALPLVIIGFFIYTLRRSRGDMMGGGFLSGFSKSPAKRFEKSEQAITFKDVAGLEGVKADLQEIVDFLKSPEKFQKLGGRVPKGVLLNGPPGTGKTLLARAVAGEAEVPFFSVNGSEFIQMFVGVGASRVRDLFRTAKESSPAIIFIDEIDAVGRQRGAGLGGGHDEREQTLNQILSEMDGFSPSQAVIVVAATNRPDVLDPALLRPGRFDRHVTVGRPTLKGREAIFKVHVRDVPLAEDVDLHRLAAGTVGLTGADIRNMVNEAALWAARCNKKSVDMSDFEYARDKILMGAKREEVLQESEKEKTAYHEAGHTLTAWHLDGANVVHKVTIIPRGRALGVTQYVPSEDRLSISKHELEHQLIVLLGGRAAELIVYGEMTVGAENDLERATNIARRMVTNWGMSDKLGPVSYKTSEEDPFLGREMHQTRHFSEHTQEMIDEEVHNILRVADEAAQKLLTERREELDAITRQLLEREELSEAELTEILGTSIQVRQREANGKVKPETVMAPESASEHSPGPAVQRGDSDE
ncbi:ATP-dependent zinc metalloprotease FtsH [Roseimaritima ulvae]|uniref:ATP-dependent zinc metalloprotease FtsH n=1 Tax=Roseimaritima ulvae TaxID=980254 RepID=A0A5B9QTZ9_9BACT|nr:ATP-dependent zinc metalloprotease FtsH [Roseimaritima ulvae]QEG41402.1 ATP-dependent zinc metalloprotease FtsH [Roseimaritima ulvae]